MAGGLEAPPVPSMYVANPIVVDFDADGQQEAAFPRWYVYGDS